MDGVTFDIHCDRLKRYLKASQDESFKNIFYANVNVVYQ